MKNNLVSVCLWGNEVGKLYWDERRRVAVFQFDAAFVEAGIDLSPIECPLSALTVSRRLPVDGIKDRMYQGLPAFICDSLPDRWGNEVFTAWCAQQGLSLHDITPVDRLAYMGKRAMGALEFMPAYDIDAHLDIELSALYRQAEEILRMRGSYAITPDQNISLDALYMVGTSAGGQQAKAVVAIDRESGEIRSGQTELPDSYDQYILKFNNDENGGLPRTLMEMAYFDMANDAGIQMMPSRLIEVDGKQHFLTQRFDRNGNEKIHTQTAFSMYTGTTDYDDLFYIGRCLDLTAEEQMQQYVRLVFNVVACNCDDHSKNFSYMLRRNGRWQLAPAYDLNFVVDPFVGIPMLHHQLTIGGQAAFIGRDALLRCAERNDIKHAREVIDKVKEVVGCFPKYAVRYGIDQKMIDTVCRVLYKNPVFETPPSTMTSASTIEDAKILRDTRGWHISIKVNGWWHDRALNPDDAQQCEHADPEQRKNMAMSIAPKYYSIDMEKP